MDYSQEKDIMKNNLDQGLQDFLKRLGLSNYETNVYLALLNTNFSTAKEIYKKSRVPIGRIYEVLDNLNKKKLIEIQDTRPKSFKSIPPNLTFHKLISYLDEDKQKEITLLYDQARFYESKLHNSELPVKLYASKIFSSTQFEVLSIMATYLNYINESSEEILFNAFLNKTTLKIIPLNKILINTFIAALDRGVSIKFLWSFEYDERPLSEQEQLKNKALFSTLVEKFSAVKRFLEKEQLEIKYIHKKLPTYYDVFDKKRVLIKLQNPLKPSQIFACINMLDPNLAKNLRKQYFDLWLFEALS